VFGNSAALSVADHGGIVLNTSGFKATDTLELTAFKFGASETHVFVENTAKTFGVLKITDGTQTARITLFGQYVAAGFHLANDGHGGTAVTYSATSSAHADLAAGHGV
jgi:hypothetical protein